MKFRFFAVLAIPFLFSSAAQAWDYTGHMLVDQIAYEQLKPEVRDAVSKLVVLLDNKYNDHKPYNFITAGAWLDDLRSMPKYPYSKIHYVDGPYTFSGLPFVEPEPPHVLSGIDDAVKTLKNKEASDQQKADALGILMHLVGDIHQPLHCAEWNDRGGNGYLIHGIPFSDLLKKQVPSLHAYWDKAFRFNVTDGKIIELYSGLLTTERPDAADAGRIYDEAAKIMKQFPKSSLEAQLRFKSPRDWALESHIIACLFAYPVRPHPGDTEVVTLGNDYVQRSCEIACARVALAGYRLAEILQELFGE